MQYCMYVCMTHLMIDRRVNDLAETRTMQKTKFEISSPGLAHSR